MTFRYCPTCAAPLAPRTEQPDAGRLACPDGHYVHYENPAVTTFALLEREGCYLALRRADPPFLGEWDLPGGFIEAGEYPEAALRREIREEAGLEVTDLEVIGAWTGRYGTDGKWTVDIGYRCRAEPGELTLSPEKSQAAWFTMAEYPRPAFNSERLGLAALRARHAR